MRKNVVQGCIAPPHPASPSSHGTPARKATSPSPVASTTIFALIRRGPALVNTSTPAMRPPSMTGARNVAW